MTVEEILKACNGRLYSGNSGAKIAGISTDTRTIKRGQIFLAIKGKRYNGHAFAAGALKKKAAGIIVSGLSRPVREELSDEKVVIRVKDTLSALLDIAGFHRGRFGIPVVAITGSNGKTTTKEMLACILSRRLETLKSEASFNNEVGVPLSLLRITSRHEICVLEIGMSAQGEIRNLARVAKPDVGVITNIGPAHLQNFGSLAKIAGAKAELLEALDGVCVLNADDEYFGMLRKRCKAKLITFSIEKAADFRADSLRYLPSGEVTFKINRKLEVRLCAGCGRHNVYNALAAAAAASCFGVGGKEIRRALADFRLPPQRSKVREYGTITVINDTYNANPASMRAAIELLKGFPQKGCGERAGKRGRRIAAIGDMLELGNRARESHEQIGRFAARSGIHILFAVGNFSKVTVEAAKREGMEKAFSCKTRGELIKKLLSEAEPCDTILVKGSRAMRMEEVVEAVNCELRIL
jgi:UDP-N-acetylmuramoyl-tripeptide--D-alanyl-D-alanine ligase